MRTDQVRHRAVPLIVACGLLTVFPSPAADPVSAAGRWSRPVRISAPGNLAIYPQAAATGRGNAVAVWAQAGAGSDYVIMASWRRAGAGWARPVGLSAAQGQFAFDPQVADSPAGAAVAVWSTVSTSPSGSHEQVIQAAVRRSPRQRWSRPMQISPAGVAAGQPQITMDRHGHAIAIWTATGGGQDHIDASTLTLTNGRWSSPAHLASANQRLLVPQIAVNKHGDLVAAWKRWIRGGPLSPGGVRSKIAAAVKPTGSRSWLPAVTLGTELDPPGQGVASFEFPGPQVAIDTTGDAAITWQGQYRHTTVPEVSIRRTGGHWQKPAPISTAFGLYPRIATDARGDMTALWQGTHGSVVAATRPASAHDWSAPQTVYHGNPDVIPYPQLAVSARGEAVATWSGNPVRAAVRQGPAAAWQHPATLGFGGVSQVALDPLGNAIVVWQQPTRHPSGIVVRAVTFTRQRTRPAQRRPARP